MPYEQPNIGKAIARDTTRGLVAALRAVFEAEVAIDQAETAEEQAEKEYELQVRRVELEEEKAANTESRLAAQEEREQKKFEREEKQREALMKILAAKVSGGQQPTQPSTTEQQEDGQPKSDGKSQDGDSGGEKDGEKTGDGAKNAPEQGRIDELAAQANIKELPISAEDPDQPVPIVTPLPPPRTLNEQYEQALAEKQLTALAGGGSLANVTATILTEAERDAIKYQHIVDTINYLEQQTGKLTGYQKLQRYYAQQGKDVPSDIRKKYFEDKEEADRLQRINTQLAKLNEKAEKTGLTDEEERQRELLEIQQSAALYGFTPGQQTALTTNALKRLEDEKTKREKEKKLYEYNQQFTQGKFPGGYDRRGQLNYLITVGELMETPTIAFENELKQLNEAEMEDARQKNREKLEDVKQEDREKLEGIRQQNREKLAQMQSGVPRSENFKREPTAEEKAQVYAHLAPMYTEEELIIMAQPFLQKISETEEGAEIDIPGMIQEFYAEASYGEYAPLFDMLYGDRKKAFENSPTYQAQLAEAEAGNPEKLINSAMAIARAERMERREKTLIASVHNLNFAARYLQHKMLELRDTHGIETSITSAGVAKFFYSIGGKLLTDKQVKLLGIQNEIDNIIAVTGYLRSGVAVRQDEFDKVGATLPQIGKDIDINMELAESTARVTTQFLLSRYNLVAPFTQYFKPEELASAVNNNINTNEFLQIDAGVSDKIAGILTPNNLQRIQLNEAANKEYIDGIKAENKEKMQAYKDVTREQMITIVNTNFPNDPRARQAILELYDEMKADNQDDDPDNKDGDNE